MNHLTSLITELDRRRKPPKNVVLIDPILKTEEDYESDVGQRRNKAVKKAQIHSDDVVANHSCVVKLRQLHLFVELDLEGRLVIEQSVDDVFLE